MSDRRASASCMIDKEQWLGHVVEQGLWDPQLGDLGWMMLPVPGLAQCWCFPYLSDIRSHLGCFISKTNSESTPGDFDSIGLG